MKKVSLSSNVEWKAWGERDPLYAVATCPHKNKNGSSPWLDGEFYALGESDWCDFHEKWRGYGLEAESCVEIGCGAGRITKQLANCFRAVHAVDVSPHMLEYAKKHVTAGNVSFALTPGAKLPLPDSSVSAAFSCHVFQHFNSREVAGAYFEEIYRVFSPGGSLMVHLPIYSWPNASVSFKVLFGVQRAISDFKAEVNRWMIGAGIFRPLMRRLVYQVDWLYAELGKIGFVGIELIMVSPRSSNDPHAFVLARKQRSGLSAIQAPADPAREYSPGQRLAA